MHAQQREHGDAQNKAAFMARVRSFFAGQERRRLGKGRMWAAANSHAMFQQLAQQQAALRQQAEAAQPATAPTPVPAAADTGAEAGGVALAPLVEGFDESNPDTWGSPSQNDACPCGSGKKFKHCHGAFV